MGLLKKIFKPVSKVLDKVIPNEIKPALPYLAAFAPVFGPTAGMFGSTMAKRALLSGGANIFAQLAQEGNEGDINLLSAGLGALTGAMTAPGAQGKFADMKFGERTFAEGIRGQPVLAGFDTSNVTGLQKAANVGLDALSAGSKIMSAGAKDPFSMAGLKAASLPAATATGDLMEAEARRLNKQAIIDQALGGLEEGFSNADASEAIRLAMLQYGFSDDEISETITAAGYKVGGRVGYRFGGIDAAIDKVEDENIKESMKFASDIGDMDIPMMDLVEEFEIIFKRKPSSLDELKQFYRDFYEYKGPGDSIKFQEKIKEKMTVGAKDGGLMATRINMENGGDLLALGEGFKSERLNRMAMDMFGKTLRELNADEMEMLREEFNIMKGVTEAKDGGLMNLGGKEMDLRGGGFVPIGKKEKADDVPARLSKNEFVMTADAVRAAGGGSVNKGAKRMYDLMNNLEARA
jgi:hypothetical protein